MLTNSLLVLLIAAVLDNKTEVMKANGRTATTLNLEGLLVLVLYSLGLLGVVFGLAV